MGSSAAKSPSQQLSTPKKFSDGNRAAGISPKSQSAIASASRGTPPRERYQTHDLSNYVDGPKEKRHGMSVENAKPEADATKYSACKRKIEGVTAALSKASLQLDGLVSEEAESFHATRTIDGTRLTVVPESPGCPKHFIRANIADDDAVKHEEAMRATIAEAKKTRRVLLEGKALKAMISGKNTGDIKKGSFVTIRGTGNRGIVKTMLSSGVCFVQLEDDGRSIRVHAEHLQSLDSLR